MAVASFDEVPRCNTEVIIHPLPIQFTLINPFQSMATVVLFHLNSINFGYKSVESLASESITSNGESWADSTANNCRVINYVEG